MNPEMMNFLMAHPELAAQLQSGAQQAATGATGPQSDVDAMIDRLSAGIRMQPQAPMPMPQAPGSMPWQGPMMPVAQATPAPIGDQRWKWPLSPAATAQISGALPTFGAQIGGLVDTLSDERSKTAVRPARDAVDDLLDHLSRR